jgi:rubredoxin
MADVHIHRPTTWHGRTIAHCTTCRRRRRFIVCLYAHYQAEWVCGGCGHVFVSGEGRKRDGLASRRRKQAWVKEKWNTCKRLSEAIKELLLES